MNIYDSNLERRPNQVSSVDGAFTHKVIVLCQLVIKQELNCIEVIQPFIPISWEEQIYCTACCISDPLNEKSSYCLHVQTDGMMDRSRMSQRKIDVTMKAAVIGLKV